MKHANGFTMLATAALLLSLASTPATAREHEGSKDKKVQLYPDSSRKEPKLDLTSEKESKNLNAGLAAGDAGDNAKALELLQPLADGAKSKYAQALALQGLASLKYKDGDYKGAIDLLQRSLDIGVMPNDTYFQLVYMKAQLQMADEQYQASLDTLAKWRAEGKKETADSYAVEANDDYRLGKYPEAIAAVQKAKSLSDKPNPQWDQILLASYSQTGQSDKAAELAQQQLAANPDDPDALNNAVTTLMQAQKYPEAIAMMEKARAAGSLKGEAGYTNLATLYFNQGQSSDDPKVDAGKAVAVLKEGMAKGMVTSNASNLLLLGESQYLVGDTSDAMATYTKAMPLAKDGEVALQAANLQLTESKYGEARELIQQAIAKGVKHKGRAYLVLSESERGLKHKSAQVAALKMAAQDPETAERANAQLKKLGAAK